MGPPAEPQPTNAAIADRLQLFSSLLELGSASPYAARAYRRAAELIRALPTPAAELVRSGRIRELRGIGPGIEEKLRELVETGRSPSSASSRRSSTPELVALGRVVGLGANRMLALGRELDVSTVAELRSALDEGRVRTVPGIGPATEARIREGLERPPRARRGLTLDRSRALNIARRRPRCRGRGRAAPVVRALVRGRPRARDRRPLGGPRRARVACRASSRCSSAERRTRSD